MTRVMNMSNKYPKGSYVYHSDGRRKKVLEELGDIRFLSHHEHELVPDWESRSDSNSWHIGEMERDGWKVEGEEAWKPERGQAYWHLNSALKPCTVLNEETVEDMARLDIGNCYRSKKEAEAVAELVRKLIGDRSVDPKKA